MLYYNTSRAALCGALLAWGAASVAVAAPKVITDIGPVHGLVSQVMAGVGTPEVLVPQNADPHAMALRPSDARGLSNADAVIWIGEGMTPAMASVIENLTPDGAALELLELLPEAMQLAPREEAVFHDDDHGDDHDGDDHGDEHGHDKDHADHGHEKEDHGDEHADGHSDDHGDDHGDDHSDHAHGDDHADHGADKDHEDHAGDDDHKDGDDHADHHGHDHGDLDPHAWLDPRIAVLWVAAIAEHLAEQDPQNAAAYQANAAQVTTELEALTAELEALLSGEARPQYVVLHDAFQYFEVAFEVPALATLSDIVGTAPSPSRLAQLRDTVEDMKPACLLHQSTAPTALLQAVGQEDALRWVEVDQLGSNLDLGPEFYPALLRQVATAVAGCR
ncbi:MAG: zinc ABC transporter substrate-binding protein [Pseudomonadota bacterium]